MANTSVLARDRFNAPIQVLRPATTQTVAVGASAAASTAVSNATVVVRLISTSNCHVAFGSAPTAGATDMLLVANSPEYFKVNPADKVSVIQDSAAGTLYLTEMQ